jgi:hypothetical protein
MDNLVKTACSLVIGWSGEQTLQLKDVVEAPEADDLRRFQDAYFAQWADGREHAKWLGIVVHPH